MQLHLHLLSMYMHHSLRENISLKTNYRNLILLFQLVYIKKDEMMTNIAHTKRARPYKIFVSAMTLNPIGFYSTFLISITPLDPMIVHQILSPLLDPYVIYIMMGRGWYNFIYTMADTQFTDPLYTNSMPPRNSFKSKNMPLSNIS